MRIEVAEDWLFGSIVYTVIMNLALAIIGRFPKHIVYTVITNLALAIIGRFPNSGVQWSEHKYHCLLIIAV